MIGSSLVWTFIALVATISLFAVYEKEVYDWLKLEDASTTFMPRFHSTPFVLNSSALVTSSHHSFVTQTSSHVSVSAPASQATITEAPIHLLGARHHRIHTIYVTKSKPAVIAIERREIPENGEIDALSRDAVDHLQARHHNQIHTIYVPNSKPPVIAIERRDLEAGEFSEKASRDVVHRLDVIESRPNIKVIGPREPRVPAALLYPTHIDRQSRANHISSEPDQTNDVKAGDKANFNLVRSDILETTPRIELGSIRTSPRLPSLEKPLHNRWVDRWINPGHQNGTGPYSPVYWWSHWRRDAGSAITRRFSLLETGTPQTGIHSQRFHPADGYKTSNYAVKSPANITFDKDLEEDLTDTETHQKRGIPAVLKRPEDGWGDWEKEQKNLKIDHELFKAAKGVGKGLRWLVTFEGIHAAIKAYVQWLYKVDKEGAAIDNSKPWGHIYNVNTPDLGGSQFADRSIHVTVEPVIRNRIHARDFGGRRNRKEKTFRPTILPREANKVEHVDRKGAGNEGAKGPKWANWKLDGVAAPILPRSETETDGNQELAERAHLHHPTCDPDFVPGGKKTDDEIEMCELEGRLESMKQSLSLKAREPSQNESTVRAFNATRLILHRRPPHVHSQPPLYLSPDDESKN